MESERLVTAAVNVIRREILTEQEIVNWIKSFEGIERPSTLPQSQYFLENTLAFLRALYFRLKYRRMSTNIIDEIEKTNNNLNSYFNNANME